VKFGRDDVVLDGDASICRKNGQDEISGVETAFLGTMLWW